MEDKNLELKDYVVGTVVQLKSGGPYMTVSVVPSEEDENDEDDTYVECSWFKNEEPLLGEFDYRTLKVIVLSDW
jgi:uncharacterized protein YodC (DUF2158 family)